MYSFIAYAAFSFCLRREDQFVAFFLFHLRHEDMSVVMVNDPFPDLPFFFLVVKNPYDQDHKSVFGFYQKNTPLICFKKALSVKRE